MFLGNIRPNDTQTMPNDTQTMFGLDLQSSPALSRTNTNSSYFWRNSKKIIKS